MLSAQHQSSYSRVFECHEPATQNCIQTALLRNLLSCLESTYRYVDKLQNCKQHLERSPVRIRYAKYGRETARTWIRQHMFVVVADYSEILVQC